MRYTYLMERKKKKELIVLASVAGGLIVTLILLMWIRTLSSSFSDFVCRYVSRPWIFIIGQIGRAHV